MSNEKYRFFYDRQDYDGTIIMLSMGAFACFVFMAIELVYVHNLVGGSPPAIFIGMLIFMAAGMAGFAWVCDNPKTKRIYIKGEKYG
jgi:hypothetical protein